MDSNIIANTPSMPRMKIMPAEEKDALVRDLIVEILLPHAKHSPHFKEHAQKSRIFH